MRSTGGSISMAFPELDCEMIPVMSELGDIPDDLDLHFEDGCVYHRIALAESKYHRWLTAIDIGYREYNESPCSGIIPINFVTFGYEIILFDQVDNVAYSTMNPLEARCAIPAEMRPLTIDITLLCYQRLLEACDPDYIELQVLAAR
jgi:hypothetical protein